MADLNLEHGEEDDEPEQGGKGGRGQSERSRRRHRADIKERLHAIFSRLADSLEGRGDLELAEMIREDSRAMVEGLTSAIRKVPAFASPILGLLAILEPLIAFGRILRLLGRRWRERRLEAGWEEEAAAADELRKQADELRKQADEGYEPEPAEPVLYEEPPVVAEPWRLDNE